LPITISILYEVLEVYLENKTIFITGGTGSFGQKATEIILKQNPKKLIIYSRDELKQFEMSKKFPDSVYMNLRYFVGDIRDYDRLRKAMRGVDYVIHAAALKQVPSCEYNPYEAVKTNIIGTQNVIDACVENNVERAIFLSTDKSVEAVNLYGATKAVAERLWINASISNKTIFASVRYGNVMGSRGSVIPYFIGKRNSREDIPITHPEMTRFWITLDDAVSFVLNKIKIATKGCIYIPKLSCMNIVDLARAIAPYNDITYTGIRPGEKLNEKLISSNERNVVELEDQYIIYPTHNVYTNDEVNALRVEGEGGFNYSSDSGDRMTKEQLKQKMEDL
jgi:UDP-N-acetylglucosamine 4,6-dehydratase